MPTLDAETERAILSAYDKLGSLRQAATATGRNFRTVQRVVRDRQAATEAPESNPGLTDIEKLIDTRVAAMFAALGPINEGPPAPQPQSPARPEGPRLLVSPTIHARTGWLSDIHCPYHDPVALDAAFQLFEEWRIDLLVLGGDQLDCYGISRYGKAPSKLRDTLQKEIDAFRPIRDRIVKLGCRVVYLEGNHDYRVKSLVADNPALDDLQALEWHKLADLPESWEILPNQSRFRMGNLDFIHGDLRGRGVGSKHIASGMLAKLKRSTLFGHYHRAQFHPEPDGDGIIRAGFSTGHMCNTSKAADYCPINDWTQGFATIDTDPATGLFEVRQHLVHSGKFRHAGKTYG